MSTNSGGQPVNYQILLDVPSSKPALGFEDIAAALTHIIEESNPRFAIGIFGSWGSGKTTLMHSIERKLNPQISIPVNFCAWRYEKEEHLIVPLLDTMRDALVLWAKQYPGSQGDKARKTASTIGKVMKCVAAGLSFRIGVPGAMEVSYDANASLKEEEKISKKNRDAMVPRSFYHASFQALAKAFNDLMGDDNSKRIVVFIDDLDRCLPQGALEVLESMKLFFDFNGFVFVVGLDRRVVEWCIDMKYAKENVSSFSEEESKRCIKGHDYIKKLFQVPYSIARVNVRQLDDFLNYTYAESGLPDEQVQELRDEVRPHLDYILTDEGVNPREIKRYINSYILQVMIKPYLNRRVILAMQTIQFRQPEWENVLNYLYAYPILFPDALRRQFDGEERAVEKLNPALGTLPDSFLEYVQPGGSGNELLNEENLDEYIFSGEAARYEADPGLIRLIPGLARMRDAIQAYGRISVDSPPEAFRDILSQFDNELKGVLSYGQEYMSSPQDQKLMNEVYNIPEKLTSFAFTDSAERKEAVMESITKEVEQAISKLITRFVKLLQTGGSRDVRETLEAA